MDWVPNERGAGFYFGLNVVQKFTHENNVDFICRSHQLQMNGYGYIGLLFFRKMFDEKLVTVWSAPNYCYRCGNQAAILALNDKVAQNLTTFTQAERQFPEGATKVSLHFYLAP